MLKSIIIQDAGILMRLLVGSLPLWLAVVFRQVRNPMKLKCISQKLARMTKLSQVYNTLIYKKKNTDYRNILFKKSMDKA